MIEALNTYFEIIRQLTFWGQLGLVLLLLLCYHFMVIVKSKIFKNMLAASQYGSLSSRIDDLNSKIDKLENTSNSMIHNQFMKLDLSNMHYLEKSFLQNQANGINKNDLNHLDLFIKGLEILADIKGTEVNHENLNTAKEYFKKAISKAEAELLSDKLLTDYYNYLGVSHDKIAADVSLEADERATELKEAIKCFKECLPSNDIYELLNSKDVRLDQIKKTYSEKLCFNLSCSHALIYNIINTDAKSFDSFKKIFSLGNIELKIFLEKTRTEAFNYLEISFITEPGNIEPALKTDVSNELRVFHDDERFDELIKKYGKSYHNCRLYEP